MHSYWVWRYSFSLTFDIQENNYVKIREKDISISNMNVSRIRIINANISLLNNKPERTEYFLKVKTNSFCFSTYYYYGITWNIFMKPV